MERVSAIIPFFNEAGWQAKVFSGKTVVQFYRFIFPGIVSLGDIELVEAEDGLAYQALRAAANVVIFRHYDAALH